MRGKGGEIYSLHAVGLSVLILPVLCGSEATRPCRSSWPSWPRSSPARSASSSARLLRDDALAAGTAWVIALGPPLVHYAGLVFTEVPAALILAVALRAGGAQRRELERRSRSRSWALLLAFLPWLNVRYVLLAVVVGLYALWRGPRAKPALVADRRRGSPRPSGLALYHHALYGFYDPRLVYGRRPEFSLAIAARGSSGPAPRPGVRPPRLRPVLRALRCSGFVFLWRRDRRLAVVAAAAVAVTVLHRGDVAHVAGRLQSAGAVPGAGAPARWRSLAAAALRARLTAGAALLIGFTVWAGCLGRRRAAARPSRSRRDGSALARGFGSGGMDASPAGLRAGRRRPASSGRSSGPRLSLAAVLARRRPTPTSMALATAGLLAAVCASSVLSHARTEGRDAVRLVGQPRSPSRDGAPRPAPRPIGDPRCSTGARSTSRIGTRAVPWWAAASPSPPGAYRCASLETTCPRGRCPLSTCGRRIGGRRRRTVELFRRAPAAMFRLTSRWRRRRRAVTLRLRGGGARLLRRIALEAQPCGRGPV